MPRERTTAQKASAAERRVELREERAVAAAETPAGPVGKAPAVFIGDKGWHWGPGGPSGANYVLVLGSGATLSGIDHLRH